MDGWMDGWMDGCRQAGMNAWMHACTYVCMHVCMYACGYACVQMDNREMAQRRHGRVCPDVSASRPPLGQPRRVRPVGNPGNSLNAHLRESKRTTQQSIQPLAAKAKAIAQLTRCESGLGRYRDHTTHLADDAHAKRTGTPDVALSGNVRGPWPTRVVSHGYDRALCDRARGVSVLRYARRSCRPQTRERSPKCLRPSDRSSRQYTYGRCLPCTC
jgi:hypothetical protein